MSNEQRGSRGGRKIFKNPFGHYRAVWRIALYVAFVVMLFRLGGLFEHLFFQSRGENLGDYALLLDRLGGKFFQMLFVLVPAMTLLRWFDKRPIPLLGIGFYKGAPRELCIGMSMGVLLIALTVSVLSLSGLGSFSFNGFSASALVYLLCALLIFIVSAAYEEILFRGYIFQALIEGTNFWITLGIFSLLFGAAHLSNAGATVFSIAVTIVAGLFMGVVYFKTRALWMCIGAHFMWNWTMGPVFGMGLADSKFLRRSVFAYEPSKSFLMHGQDVMGEIVLGALVAALTVYLWRAKWLKPAAYNRELWAKYPPRIQ
jgi:uncharacterized protein